MDHAAGTPDSALGGPDVSDPVRVVPANRASCEDLLTVFRTRGSSAGCFCQRYKLAPGEAFVKFPREERRERLLEQTLCGERDAPATSGLVAYLGDEPVGWCAVEPRPAYFGLARVYRLPWEGRAEDKADEGVWAVTCVLVRAGYRKRGIAYALASAAVDHARRSGARALEAYPYRSEVGEITWDEIHVGAESIFAAAGMREVTRPGKRRLVMRVDFAHATALR
jgi:GNAT superfamily N-acetyltransferase